MKRLLPDVLMIAFMAVVSIVFFWNPILDGKVLTGTDHDAALGSGVELQQYRTRHDGERTRWTNTIFCGMPTWQMSPSYDSTQALGHIQTAYSLWLPTVASYVFMMLLGFYILLRAFDFRAWMAALGAVLWAFSSYYFIIIAAGHIWKLLTLCFIPPTIAGVVLCYRGKYLMGVAVTGLFAALQVLSNHVQMSYYFLFVIAMMVMAYAVEAVRTKAYARFAKATACALLGALLGLCTNLSNLYHTYEYSKETMRGKTELTAQTKDAADQTDSGLERSYITAWSYGLDETWTLLVPNVKGGASQPLTRSKEAMEKANNQYLPLYQQLGQYWGEQPGTSGPVYVGAFVLFLFVLGLMTVGGPMKWALLAATVLSILLSWGKNFMPFTDFFLDYVPMYSKFRTVASILVIAEFTIPLLAMLALRRLTEQFPSLRQMLIALALTGGVCLVMWLAPDALFGNYVSSAERNALAPLEGYGWPVGQIIGNLSDMRRAVVSADAGRSLLIILVGVGVLLVYRARKIGERTMVACLVVLCLMDMWGVNRRYLNDDNFVTPRPAAQTIPMTYADECILQDTDPYYRVLNLSVSTFNDNTTSFRHKSIGGYHAAKLRRYQELIEACITPEIRALGKAETPVLNMLNARYIITSPQSAPIRNPNALGNAWFVSNVTYVDNADAELAALRTLDTRATAVSDERFRPLLGEATPDSTAAIRLTAYEANELRYEATASEDGIAVFSDIYYPGWTCTVDGAPASIARVNYVLRAVRLPRGTHEVVMTFRPRSLALTEAVAYAALAILALTIIYIACARRVRA